MVHVHHYERILLRTVLTIEQAGVKDVVTLFHNPKLPTSTRVHTLLKQLNATSVAHATEDQASDHSKQSKLERTEFELGTFSMDRGWRQ